tara:strand:+ start:38 stop:757 length:720 start_codon:yes stop_codon:yes gene_type:complete
MNKLSYLTHIDSIRAVAVLLVVFFHLDITLFQGGFISVDVFFVISGFLIMRILAHEFLETGSINLKYFYIRRIRRLMPTLFLTLFLTFMLTFLAFSPSDFMNATKSIFMSSVALSNFCFLGESNYFDLSSNFKPLLHTGSLGIEKQFYILFPASLFLLLKIFIKNIKGVTLSLIGFAFCKQYQLSYGLQTRFYEYNTIFSLKYRIKSIYKTIVMLNGGKLTIQDHLSSHHQAYSRWSPE